MKRIFIALTVALALIGMSCTTPTSESPNPEYSLVYAGNGNSGGTVPVDSGKYNEGATVTVTGQASLVKEGYSFAGWNTAADGSGTTYTAGKTFTMPASNVTLYAVWSLIPTWNVLYDGNGNTSDSVPSDGNSYIQGATVTVLGNVNNLVKDGYSFAGWNTTADGSGTSYAVGSTFAMGTSTVKLYAQWSLIPVFSVVYNGNENTSGSAPIDSNKYVTNATVTVLGNTNTLKKSAYDFAGWNTAANGTGTAYSVGSTFTMGTSNVTLYAQWTLSNTYTVSYDALGGSSAPTDGTAYLAGNSAVILSGEPTKTDNLFLGRTLTTDGSGSIYKAGDYITIGSANVTLYAKWSPKHFVGRAYSKRYFSTDTIDETKYSFTITGYGTKDSGQFSIVNASGSTFTGTYTLTSGDPITVNAGYTVEAPYYIWSFSTGESYTIPIRFVAKTSTGATAIYFYSPADAFCNSIAEPDAAIFGLSPLDLY